MNIVGPIERTADSRSALMVSLCRLLNILDSVSLG